MPERERYAYEYTVFTILEYLFARSTSEPVSKYNIMTRARLPSQRPDRVDSILGLLVTRGWVSLVKTEYSSFYRITEEGAKEYTRWIKEFLDFTRSLYSK
ncbi:MAG: hypothetical protein V1915_05105 [Candidatus Bathyarchaeota archaeon]